MAKPDPELLALRLKLGGTRITKRAFLSTGKLADKERLLPGARALAHLGVELYATRGTSEFFNQHGVANITVHKIAEDVEPNVASMMEAGKIDLVVNVLTGDNDYDENSDSKKIRFLAVKNNVYLITDADIAVAKIEWLAQLIQREREESTTYVSMRDRFMALVHDRGGFADNHGHYDKAYLITAGTLDLGQMPMARKWDLYRKLKENYTHAGLVERITRCVEFRESLGVTYQRTMVDADSIVKLKCIDAALEVKRKVAGRVALEIGIQPLEGVLQPGPRKWVEKACAQADFIGGLPSRDGPRLEAHLDVIMGMAKEMGKRVDVHVDQKGVPWEDETKLLALKTAEHGLEGRVSAVHAIFSRKSLYEQEEIAKMLCDTGIVVEVCPGAEISMEQLDMKVQMSNSLPPVPLLLKHGVKVVYGSDNTEDPFMPFSDGDPWYEARLLMDGCRTYTAEDIANIMCDKSLFASGAQAAQAA